MQSLSFSCLKSIIKDLEWGEVLKYVTEMSVILSWGDYLISNCTILPTLHLCRKAVGLGWRKGCLVTLEGIVGVWTKERTVLTITHAPPQLYDSEADLSTGLKPMIRCWNDRREKESWQSGTLVWESPRPWDACGSRAEGGSCFIWRTPFVWFSERILCGPGWTLPTTSNAVFFPILLLHVINL